jgi:general stress protein 26
MRDSPDSDPAPPNREFAASSAIRGSDPRVMLHNGNHKEHVMTPETEIEQKFWKALAADRTTMLGFVGDETGHSQPMTAQILHDADERGPIWFFTARDTDLARGLGGERRAMLQFSAKGHELFASVQGELFVDNDRATIDELWNRYVAAWYEGGKDDPKLLLLRFEPDRAQLWLNENSLVAGVKLLLGRDPKQEYQDKVADIHLDRH